MSSERTLVVDDDAIIREVVERYLGREGYTVRTAPDGEITLRIAGSEPPDLVVLDLTLPKADGLEVCRRLRMNSSVPIIMLTARGEEMDKILGLRLGADDYLAKPFSPNELVARVQAVLRRTQHLLSGTQPGAGTLQFADLSLDLQARSVKSQGETLDLTPKEFDLLSFLASNLGQVFTREQLIGRIWDYAYVGDDTTVTVHMRRLREKVEVDPVHPRHLKTVWGVGYKFEP